MQKKIAAIMLMIVLVLTSAPLAYAFDDSDSIQVDSTGQEANIEVTAPEDDLFLEDEPAEQQSPMSELVEDGGAVSFSEIEIPELPEEELPSPDSYVEGKIIVTLSQDDPAEDQIEALAHELDIYAKVAEVQENDTGAELSTLNTIEITQETVVDQLSDGSLLDPMAVVTIPEELTIAQALAIAGALPGVEDAQPNYLYYLTDTTTETLGSSNDPYLLNQEHGQWSLYRTGVLDAWDNAQVLSLSTTMNSSITTVAVLDTGAQIDHPDLAANLDTTNARDVAQSNNNVLTGDIEKHGTMVSGYVAAVTNNGMGVAGATNNRVRVLPIKVFYRTTVDGVTSSVASTEDVIEAIELVIKYKEIDGVNIRVINMSLGAYYLDANKNALNLTYEEGIARDPAFHGAVVAADNADILVVAAAGNEGSTASRKINANNANANCFCAPSDYEEVISVTSVMINDARNPSSSYNQYKDLASPGTTVRSTNSSGSTESGSGTSYAAPLVSGIAALLFAVDPSLTTDEVKEILYDTAEDLGATGRDDEFGHGLIDAEAAIEELTSQMPRPTKISQVTVDAVPNQTYTGAEVTPILSLTDGSTALIEGQDYTLSYSNNVNPSNDGAQVTVMGIGSYTGERVVNFSIIGATISTAAHVQNYGWMPSAANGGTVGTSGKGLRVEALRVDLINNTGSSLNISYQTQVQNIGWQAAKSVLSSGSSSTLNQGQIAGTSGQSLRVETLRMSLTGDLAQDYSIYYRVHVQNVGWMNWAKDGECAAGTVSLSLRMEAIQVYLAPKTSPAPANTFGGITTASNMPSVIDASPAGQKGKISYNAMVHVQNRGDVNYSNINGTTMLGTTGSSLRLEALNMRLLSQPATGDLVYSVHVQNIGWQSQRSSGFLAGTYGMSLRMEAIRISLTGELANQYDVYYRTHVQSIGWTGWAKNGQSCGSAGYSYRMEAMQILIVEKNTVAPGFNSGYFYQK